VATTSLPHVDMTAYTAALRELIGAAKAYERGAAGDGALHRLVLAAAEFSRADRAVGR